jgi:hypothetical protein
LCLQKNLESIQPFSPPDACILLIRMGVKLRKTWKTHVAEKLWKNCQARRHYNVLHLVKTRLRLRCWESVVYSMGSISTRHFTGSASVMIHTHRHLNSDTKSHRLLTIAEHYSRDLSTRLDILGNSKEQHVWLWNASSDQVKGGIR